MLESSVCFDGMSAGKSTFCRDGRNLQIWERLYIWDYWILSNLFHSEHATAFRKAILFPASYEMVGRLLTALNSLKKKISWHLSSTDASVPTLATIQHIDVYNVFYTVTKQRIKTNVTQQLARLDVFQSLSCLLSTRRVNKKIRNEVSEDTYKTQNQMSHKMKAADSKGFRSNEGPTSPRNIDLFISGIFSHYLYDSVKYLAWPRNVDMYNECGSVWVLIVRRFVVLCC